ncbi:MAG: hypothetical protein V2I35_14180 [Desulfocapsaceae bacterium]|jgi:hypothetical protein|nr:hypothetical protein [Desulfocapsaceae bacterium]
MIQDSKSPLGRDKLQSAVQVLSELVLKFPEKSRDELVREVELKFDLSPLDCEFLDRHFSKKE